MFLCVVFVERLCVRVCLFALKIVCVYVHVRFSHVCAVLWLFVVVFVCVFVFSFALCAGVMCLTVFVFQLSVCYCVHVVCVHIVCVLFKLCENTLTRQ